MTTIVLNTNISEIENKIANTSSLMTKTVFNTKISEVVNKTLDLAKYISTREFNKLRAENFTARLKQADLESKTDFDNKLTSFNKQITSNKTKHLKVQKKLNSLITKDYNFLLGRIYFATNDRSENTFIYEPTTDTSELKKYKGTDYVLSWKSNRIYISKLKPLYSVF